MWISIDRQDIKHNNSTMSSPDSDLDRGGQTPEDSYGYTPPGVDRMIASWFDLCPFLGKARDVSRFIVRAPTSPEGLRGRVDIAVATATLSAGIAFYLRGANWDWRTLGTVTLINTVMGFLVWKDMLGFMANEECREQ